MFSNFSTFIFPYSVPSGPRGPEKLLRGLKISYRQIFTDHGIVFQLFHVTNSSNSLIELAFFKFFKNNFVVFSASRAKEPPPGV